MSDDKTSVLPEGTTHAAALAYLNTLRAVYDSIAPKVRDIDWHLGRIADEYCTTDLEDGIAIQRSAHDLLEILRRIERNLEGLEKSVRELGEREAHSMDVCVGDSGESEGATDGK